MWLVIPLSLCPDCPLLPNLKLQKWKGTNQVVWAYLTNARSLMQEQLLAQLGSSRLAAGGCARSAPGGARCLWRPGSICSYFSPSWLLHGCNKIMFAKPKVSFATSLSFFSEVGDSNHSSRYGLVSHRVLLSVLQHFLCNILELLPPAGKGVRAGCVLLERGKYLSPLHFVCDKGAEHPPAAGAGWWLFWNEALRFSWWELFQHVMWWNSILCVSPRTLVSELLL